MTGFLASVASADEARIACEQGADFIDAKDPTVGALGALAPELVRQIVAEIGGRAPVGAVAGDLPMEPEIIMAAARALAATGVDYVKIGLFPDARREACIRALASLAPRVKIIGVMFADLGADAALAPLMRQAGFTGAMIDTARKREKRLLDLFDPTSLIQIHRGFSRPRGSWRAWPDRSNCPISRACCRSRRIFSASEALFAERMDAAAGSMPRRCAGSAG